jgi:hypothetical protein
LRAEGGRVSWLSQEFGENDRVTTSDITQPRTRLPGGPDGRLARWREAVTRTGTRRLVATTAVVAALMRFPGLLWPIRPDEAGFTLVARHWDPQPDSLYGVYFVDRPPPLIALVKLSDWVGGPLFIRVLGAVAAALLVLVAARTAYLVAGDRAARWTAVGTAAVAGNAMIDAVAAKGELLGVPLVVTSFWLALEALRVLPGSRTGAALLACGAGLAGTAALGLKQNMATGLVFGGVLLLGSALRREVSWPDFARLAGAALVGAALPVAATIGWCLAAGVHLDTLWYAVVSFRSDALEVIRTGSAAAPFGRLLVLALVFVFTMMAVVLGLFVRHAAGLWRERPVLTAATLAVVAVDGAGVLLGGSFWRTYLLGLVPATVLCIALLVALPDRRGTAMRRVVGVAVASCVLSLVGWVVNNQFAVEPPTETYAGQAIRDVAEPGDTIVVFGGRADIVMASGLDSPYTYLWSLPMRTLDPDLATMTSLLSSPDRPTWIVESVPFESWNGTGDPELRRVLDRYYEPHGDGCGHPVYLRNDVSREVPQPDCEASWLWSMRQ